MDGRPARRPFLFPASMNKIRPAFEIPLGRRPNLTEGAGRAARCMLKLAAQNRISAEQPTNCGVHHQYSPFP